MVVGRKKETNTFSEHRREQFWQDQFDGVHQATRQMFGFLNRYVEYHGR